MRTLYQLDPVKHQKDDANNDANDLDLPRFHRAFPQGEARVVDQQQLIRQRLDAFLQRRPSLEQLLELGILGRQDWCPGSRGSAGIGWQCWLYAMG